MENRVTHELISTQNPGTWNYAIPKATVRPGPSQEETPRACSRRDRRDSAPSHSHKIPRAAGGAAAKPWGVKGAGNTNLGAFSAAAFPGKPSLGMSGKEKPRREQGTDPKAGDVGAPPTSSSVWPAMEQKLLDLVKIY